MADPKSMTTLKSTQQLLGIPNGVIGLILAPKTLPVCLESFAKVVKETGSPRTAKAVKFGHRIPTFPPTQ